MLMQANVDGDNACVITVVAIADMFEQFNYIDWLID